MRERFFGAVKYIEENLCRPLTVQEISAAAFYSEFHFARMFRALVGQSVMSYVQQRRLASSAERLRAGGDSLLEIALDHQFGSQEAFTRAFKRAFGLTPARYRRTDGPSPYLRRPPFSRNELVEGRVVEPSILDRESFLVVGMESEFDHDTASEIPALWKRFVSRIRSVPDRAGEESYGVCESPDPRKDRFTYTAAVRVSKLGRIPRGLVGKRIPAAKYAVFTHRVRSKNLSKDLKSTLRHIWGTWLPNSPYEFAGTPDFELYDDRFDGAKVSGELDLYVPVQRRR